MDLRNVILKGDELWLTRGKEAAIKVVSRAPVGVTSSRWHVLWGTTQGLVLGMFYPEADPPVVKIDRVQYERIYFRLAPRDRERRISFLPGYHPDGTPYCIIPRGLFPEDSEGGS